MNQVQQKMTAAPVGERSGTACGAGGLTPDDSTERLDRLARSLATQDGLTAAETTAELTRLRALPGTSILVQLASASPGSRVTVGPQAGTRAQLCLVGAFCCGAAQPPDRGGDASCVLILWARTDHAGEFTLGYPPGTRRLAVVANGRLVSADIDLVAQPTLSVELDAA